MRKWLEERGEETIWGKREVEGTMWWGVRERVRRERERQGGVAEREREEGTRWCEERERGVQGGVNIKRRGQGGVSREREEDDKVVRREGEKVVWGERERELSGGKGGLWILKNKE